jgi:hypothetical protein
VREPLHCNSLQIAGNPSARVVQPAAGFHPLPTTSSILYYRCSGVLMHHISQYIVRPSAHAIVERVEQLTRLFPQMHSNLCFVLQKTTRFTRNQSKMHLLSTLVGAAMLIAGTEAQYAPWAVSATYQNNKDCQQVACWIATPSRSCGVSIADKMQSDLFKGRDRYGVEKTLSNGMWVRYWRTKFEPVDRGELVRGTCSDKSKYSVSNCQSTGSVKC